MATLGDKAVGDIVKIRMYTGKAIDFIIVHQGNPDTSLYDSSCNGTWVLMNGISNAEYWNPSRDIDYKNSNVHAFLNDTFYNWLDDNVKAAIKQVKIPYVSGVGGSVASGVNGLSTKIFQLSGYEVGWTTSTNKCFPIDGACLSYFKGTAEIDSKRCPAVGDSSRGWWLRSPVFYSGASLKSVWRVAEDGNYEMYDPSNADYTRPAFILPATQKVDSSGYLVFNSAPTISGSSSSGSNLGEKTAPFNFTYTVRDADNNTVTVKEYLDNVQQRSYTASLGATNTFQAASNAGTFQKILNGSHTIKVIATDSAGASSAAYTVSFNKQVKTATITLSSPLPADDVIKAAVVTVTGSIPQDAALEVLVTNNALDASPVWEDMSRDVQQGVNHIFTNKTATKGFAFNFKVTATRGASGTQGYISSIGGAFE